MKHLTILLTFIALAMTTNGQTLYQYPQPGLIQGDIYHGPWTDPGNFNTSIKYKGDTVIASITYSYFTIEYYFSDYYTRYDSGKVYKVCRTIDGNLCGSETLQYDFTLGLNDTFPSINLSNPIVDSVSTITLLNGQTRKYMELSNGFKTYRWIDGIGDIENGFSYAYDFEGGYNELVCHRDSTGMVYVKNPIIWDCDSLTGYNPVGIETISQALDFKISPNPTTDIINITTNDLETFDLTVQVINPLGQIVISKQMNKGASTTIDLSTLDKGLYVLKISNDTAVKVKKIIKN